MNDISIIIPTYNAGLYIDATIASVLAQTLRPAEIIVVDDVSTDDTLERLKKYGHCIKVISTGVNSGSASTPRNIGIDASRCSYFAPLDSDDVMLPQKLEKTAALLELRPHMPLIFSDFSFFGDLPRIPAQSHCSLRSYFRRFLQPIRQSFYTLNQADALKALFHENYIGASSILCSKAAWKTVGGYSEKLKSAEDLDFSFRLAERFSFGYVDQVLHRYRLRGDSKSSNKIRNFRCALSIVRRYARFPMDSVSRRALEEQIIEFEADLACLCSDCGKIPDALRHFWSALFLGGPRRMLLRPSRKLFMNSAIFVGDHLLPSQRPA